MEDDLRTKQLEQEILEGRKRRQALRAERAKSVLSPEKVTSPKPTPSTESHIETKSPTPLQQVEEPLPQEPTSTAGTATEPIFVEDDDIEFVSSTRSPVPETELQSSQSEVQSAQPTLESKQTKTETNKPTVSKIPINEKETLIESPAATQVTTSDQSKPVAEYTTSSPEPVAFKKEETMVQEKLNLRELPSPVKSHSTLPEPPLTPTRSRTASVRSPSRLQRSPMPKFSPAIALKPNATPQPGSFLASREGQKPVPAPMPKNVPPTHINNPVVCAAVPSAGASQGSFLASRAHSTSSPRPSPIRGGFVQSAMLKRENSTIMLRSRAGSSASPSALDQSPRTGSSPFRSASLSPRKGNHSRTQSTNSVSYPKMESFQKRRPSELEDIVSRPSSADIHMEPVTESLNDLSLECNLPKSSSTSSVSSSAEVQEPKPSLAKSPAKEQTATMTRRLREIAELREARLRQNKTLKSDPERQKRAQALQDMKARMTSIRRPQEERQPEEVDEPKVETEVEVPPAVTPQEEVKEVPVEDVTEPEQEVQTPELSQEVETTPAPQEEQVSEPSPASPAPEVDQAPSPMQLQPEAPISRALPEAPKPTLASHDVPSLSPPTETSTPSSPVPSSPKQQQLSSSSIHDSPLMPKTSSVRRWSPVRSTWLESALNKKGSPAVGPGEGPNAAAGSPKAYKPAQQFFPRGKVPLPMPLGEFVKQGSPKSVNVRQVVGPKVEIRTAAAAAAEDKAVKPVSVSPVKAAAVPVSPSEPVEEKSDKEEKVAVDSVPEDALAPAPVDTKPEPEKDAGISVPKSRSNLLSSSHRVPSVKKRVPSPSTAILLNRASSLRPVPKKTSSPATTPEAFGRLRSLRHGPQNSRASPGGAKDQGGLIDFKANLKRSTTSRYTAMDEGKDTILSARSSLRNTGSLLRGRKYDGSSVNVQSKAAAKTDVIICEDKEPVVEKAAATTAVPEQPKDVAPVVEEAQTAVEPEVKEVEAAVPLANPQPRRLELLEIAPSEPLVFEDEDTVPEPQVASHTTSPLSVRPQQQQQAFVLPPLDAFMDDAATESTSPETDADQPRSPLGTDADDEHDSWSHHDLPLPSPPKFALYDSPHRRTSSPPLALSPVSSHRSNYDSSCNASEDEDSGYTSPVIYAPVRPKSKPKTIRGGGRSGAAKLRGHNGAGAGQDCENTVGVEQEENMPPSVM